MERTLSVRKAVAAAILSLTLVIGFAPVAYAAAPEANSAQSANLIAVQAKIKAAKKTTGKSAAYVIKKYKSTKKYTYAKGVFKYGKPVLKGKSAVVKKINASLNKGYKKAKKNKKAIMNYAKTSGAMYNGATFSSTYTTKATYNKKGYVSFKTNYFWFAGGVTDYGTKGYVYSLKTGKKLTVGDVIEGDASQVKRKIADKYYAKERSSSTYSRILSASLSDFEFYLKNGKVVVCFPKYSFGRIGAWSSFSITLPGSY